MSDRPNIKKPVDGFAYQYQYEREGNPVKVYQLNLNGYLTSGFCVAFSPVKKNIIASASDDGTVKLWDTNTGDLKAILTGHSKSVSSVAFSSDNKTLASASTDGTVKLWDVSGKKVKEKDTLTGHSDLVFSVTFSPDNKTLASVSTDGTVKLWDVSKKKPNVKGTLGGDSYYVRSVAFSPDNTTLASTVDETVKLWDVSGDTPKEKGTLRGHSYFVRCVTWYPDGSKLVTGSSDNTVKVWDSTTKEEVCTLRGHTDDNPECTCNHEAGEDKNEYEADPWCPVTGHSGEVLSVAFSPDNKTLASASYDGTVKLWDVSGDTPKEKSTLKGHSSIVQYVTFSSDNKTLASACFDGTVELWDLSREKPKKITKLGEYSNHVPFVAFLPDDETLTCAFYDEKIVLWSCKNIVEEGETRKEVKLEKTIKKGFGPVKSVMISPDSQTMISIADDKDGKLSAQFWNLSDAVKNMLVVTPKHPTNKDNVCENITFSPDLSTFACMFSNKDIIIMSVQGKEHNIKKVIESTMKISTMAFSFDNKILALVPEKTTESVQFSDWKTKESQIMKLEPAKNVIFFPDNKTFVLCDVNTFVVWNRIMDVSNGQEYQPKKMLPKSPTGGNVESTVLLPDNETIAAFFDNGLLKLYQISAPGSVPSMQDLKFYQFTSKPRFVSFSPDGNTYICCNEKEGTKIFEAKTGKLIVDLEQSSARSAVFSPDGMTIALACGKQGIKLLRNCDEAKMAEIAFATIQIGHTKKDEDVSLLQTPEEIKLKILEKLFYTPW